VRFASFFSDQEDPLRQKSLALREGSPVSSSVHPEEARRAVSKGERSLGRFRGAGREGINRRSGEAPSYGDFTFDKVD